MFPARKLGGASSSGGGEWLVAFRTAERERFRAILSYFPRSVSPPSRRNINTPMSDSFRPLAFSRPLLLELHGISSPQDLCVAHVSGLGLCEWDEEDSDLDTFVNLVEIDASDNALQLETFYQLTALRRLDLSVNQISYVTVHEDNLTRLQTLDLSGNSISSESLLSIGLLVSLAELHLSGNELENLPEEMARQLISVDSFGLVTSQRDRFPLLRRLWLDNNLLEDVRIFAVLAGLKRLEYLNLSHNKIFSLPHLHFLPKEVIERLEEETLREQQQQQQQGRTNNSMVEGGEGFPSSKRGQNTGDSNMENLAKILSDISVISGQSPRQNTSSEALSDTGEASSRPYHSLIELDLSCNQIYYPEDVVACARWRSLKYLRLQGNPITCQQRGVPAILQTELVDRGKEVTLSGETAGGERAKKRANKLAAIAANAAPRKISDSLPPLPAKRGLPLTIHRDDAYSQPSSVTPISQARTYPGNFPGDSGTSLLPALSSQERRPCTIVTGKMSELMSPDKHRRPTLDTDSQSPLPSTQSQSPSRETFFMTQSERDPREEAGLELDSASGGFSLAARTEREERVYDLLPSECVEELQELFRKDEDEMNFGAESRYKNINASTRQLSYLLQHPLSLPALTNEPTGAPGSLDLRYKHCLQRNRAVKKGRGAQTEETKAITHTPSIAKQEVEVDDNLERAMSRGGDRDRREVNKLFASLQEKYNKIRSSHYQDDAQLPLSTPIQNPQVY